MTLWAVTCHFNPAGFRRKLVNYRTFRQRLDIPLLAVELSYDGHFELSAGDADILLQLHATDVMWQKERLLNVGIARLPNDCEYVAWLDADVIFERQGWAMAAVDALQKHQLCQPFQAVVHLPPHSNGEPGSRTAIHRFESFAYAHVTEQPIEAIHSSTLFSNRFRPGHAWCGRRELLAKHGLYDRNIVGGADGVMAYCAIGRIEEAIAYHRMPPAHADDFRRWAEGFGHDVDGAVSFLEGDLLHLWHGDLADRQYIGRRKILAEFDYDPSNDIAIETNGCWRWNSPKHAMHRRIHEYFFDRHEDGRDSESLGGPSSHESHSIGERKIEDL